MKKVKFGWMMRRNYLIEIKTQKGKWKIVRKREVTAKMVNKKMKAKNKSKMMNNKLNTINYCTEYVN